MKTSKEQGAAQAAASAQGGEAERSRFDLLGIGECMVEFYSDAPLSTASSLTRAYGGDVLNSLVACARLGANCGFITQVGNDPFGDGLLKAWQAEGINCDHAPQIAGDNGMYFISVASDGEREFTYRRQGTPASQLHLGSLNEDYLQSTRWLLLSGITQALSESARVTTLAAARIAKRLGVQVAYDPNYRPRLWDKQGGIDAARAAFLEIAPYADWLLPSHPADSILLGDSFNSSNDAGFFTAQGFTKYCPNIALKCGADGAIVSTATGLQIIPGAKATQVLDTTGAGDLWNGSFIYQLMEKRSADKAAAFANHLAAAKLAYRGAIPPVELYRELRAS
ncbi:sugar kinase [Roseateles sp.]|uniref:sugar kinase n=1 Tax=Roseateles sp. TaxID=1971397 RepID=UPI003BA7E486